MTASGIKDGNNYFDVVTVVRSDDLIAPPLAVATSLQQRLD